MKSLPPALRFLLIFVVLYLVLNGLYALWIAGWYPQADPATRWVGQQTAACLRWGGYHLELVPVSDKPLIGFVNNNDTVINLFEGCNGINVMIVFISFVIAFGGPVRKMIPFILGGLLLIHGLNLVRVGFLFWLAETDSTWFYYFHKYLFTAFLYAFVFVAWWIWIRWHD